MSDLLAIFGPAGSDTDLLDGIAAYRPTRVTLLLPGAQAELMQESSAQGDALRDRLAQLMAAIERDTGATVVGLAGERAQLEGWRFDRELAARVPLAA
jgi:hypothetical protein